MNNSNDVQIFAYTNKNVRTIIKDGEPWFVLKDVCDVLEITNSKNVAARLDDDEKGVHLMDSLGGTQKTTIINKPGLYKVILRSDKPGAKKFMNWVTHQVLPAIRKNGYYIAEEPVQLELQFSDSDKLTYTNAVVASRDCVTIRTLARILKGAGIFIGRKRLFKKLREDGFLVKAPLLERNNPTQKALEIKVLRLCNTFHSDPSGRIKIRPVTMVTGIGQIFFVNYFTKQNYKVTAFKAQQLNF